MLGLVDHDHRMSVQGNQRCEKLLERRDQLLTRDIGERLLTRLLARSDEAEVGQYLIEQTAGAQPRVEDHRQKSPRFAERFEKRPAQHGLSGPYLARDHHQSLTPAQRGRHLFDGA